MGSFETIRLRPSQRDFFCFVLEVRFPLTNRASGGCHDDGVPQHRFAPIAIGHHPEKVIGIKSESVISFVGIRKQRKSFLWEACVKTEEEE